LGGREVEGLEGGLGGIGRWAGPEYGKAKVMKWRVREGGGQQQQQRAKNPNVVVPPSPRTGKQQPTPT
jgi:hypothetical protein